MVTLSPGQPRGESALVAWAPDGARLRAGAKDYFAPLVTSPDGAHDRYATLARLARAAAADGVELKGCAGCARFRFSGMAQQSSGGGKGYCTLVGFRNTRALVAVDFVCGEHDPVAGWPDDLNAALEARLALARREPKPSRQNAFEGALLGLGAAADSEDVAGAVAAAEALAARRAAASPPAGFAAAVPVGLFSWRDKSRLRALGRACAPPDAGAGAFEAAALLVSLALEKRSADETRAALTKENLPLTTLVGDILSRFGRWPHDFDQAVAGENAALVGAVWGAFNGADSIPAGRREALSDEPALRDVARRLWDAST